MQTVGTSDGGVDFELTGPDGERIIIQVKGATNTDARSAEPAKLLAVAAKGLESAATSIDLADAHIAASKSAVGRLRGLKFAA